MRITHQTNPTQAHDDLCDCEVLLGMDYFFLPAGACLLDKEGGTCPKKIAASEPPRGEKA